MILQRELLVTMSEPEIHENYMYSFHVLIVVYRI